ncbi:MAG: hypothetical protein KDA96_07890, partial [Planctomycetaceae bacterium]|nr:hypothetical protein [Planctomycetaceae bacterium]
NIPSARVLYTMQEGIVIQYQASRNDWYPMPHRAVIHPGEEFAAPFPFNANFDVEQGDLQVTLVAGSRVKNLSPSEVAPFGLELERGQLLIAGGSALQDGNKLPYPLAIQAQDSMWRLELMTADTRFGLEIIPKLPYEITPGMGTDNYRGMLYVLQGTVRFADGNGQVQVVNAHQALSLSPEDLRAASPVVVMASAENATDQSPPFPSWMTEEEKRESMTVRKAKLSYERLFQTDQSVEQSMSPHILNKNPIVASWAVDSLGHAGDIHSLVLALVTPDQPLEVVQMAKRHLQEWLIQNPEEHNKILAEELEAALAPDDRAIVTQLLWGISLDQAKDPEMSQQIVGLMNHNLLGVREMAFDIASYYTNRQLHFRPDASDKHRQPMLLRWETYLEKNEGKLAP